MTQAPSPLRAPAEVPPDASPNSQNLKSDPVGIDMPGLGYVSAVNLPGFDGAPGQVPPALRTLLREELIIKLLFSARNLAVKNLVERDPWLTTERRGPHCKECKHTAKDGVHLDHSTRCQTGAVLAAIEELSALYGFNSQSTEKEAAPAEGASAGDGIRSRGILLTEAARALRQAALEELVELGGRLTWSCNVCGSSTTGLDKTERDIVHGCDCWVGNALVVLSSDDLEGGAR